MLRGPVSGYKRTGRRERPGRRSDGSTLHRPAREQRVADESLFGRGRGDRSEGAPDVDKVFSRAVERQLEEQRELNRLVQETTDRLAALEDGLRSFRDQTATNLTSLRAEVQDHTARLGEDVAERLQQVAAEVDRLRSSSTDHQVRLVQLAEAAEAAISALEVRQQQLTEELADVSEQLRTDDRHEAVVAALDRFEIGLASRFDDRFGGISHRLGRLQEQVQETTRGMVEAGEDRTALERELGEIRALIEEQRSSTELLEQTTERVVERALTPRDESLDEVRERLSGLDALHRRLDVLGQLRQRLDALGSVPDRLDALDAIPARMDVLDEIRDTLAPLDARLDQLRGGLETLDSRLTVLEGHVETQTRAVTTSAEEHGDALRRVEEATVSAGPELVSQVRRALAPVADDLADLQDQLRLLRASSADDEENLAALRTELADVITTQLAEVRAALDEQRATVDARMRATSDSVDEHREAVASDLRAHREELEAQVGALLEAVETRLDDIDTLLGTSLPGSLARQRDELASALSEPLAGASERLASAREELRGVAAELGGLPGELDQQIARGLERAVDAARDEARTATRQVEEATGRLDEVQERLSGLETSLVTYLEARDARLERERMEVLRDLVEEFAEGLSRRDRRRLGRRLDEVRERVAASLPGGDATSGSHETEPQEPEPQDDEPRGLLAALLGEPAGTSVEEQLGEDGDELAAHELAADQPLEGEPIEEPGDDGHRCPECGFVAGNAGGLASHRRTHA